jgi:hypothetical protein
MMIFKKKIWFENLQKFEKKKNMKREYLTTSNKKETLDLQKIKNHVTTFSYWF